MKRAFDHPHDTPLSSMLRFGTEVVAWIAGPWAATLVSPWLAVPVLVILIGLPSIFSTNGDKRTIIVNTPGPLRVLIELLQYAVAASAPWLVWSTPAATFATGIALTSLALGTPRLGWLLRGAPGASA